MVLILWLQFLLNSKKSLGGDSKFTDTVKHMLSSRLSIPDCPNCNYRRRYFPLIFNKIICSSYLLFFFFNVILFGGHIKKNANGPFGPLSVFDLTVFCVLLASVPHNKANIFTSRCTCDDCSLSHILTCGIMDAPMAEDLHLKLPLQAEPTRDYLSEVHPPSMSSGSSGSGSAPGSPITIQQHPRLILPQDGTTTLWVKTVLFALFYLKRSWLLGHLKLWTLGRRSHKYLSNLLSFMKMLLITKKELQLCVFKYALLYEQSVSWFKWFIKGISS